MEIFKHKLLVVFLVITGLILALGGVIIVGNAGNLPQQLILHFDSFHGIDMFGEYADLWLVWITGFMFAVLNAVLAEEFFYKNRVLTYIFLSVNVIIALLTLIVVSTVISVS